MGSRELCRHLLEHSNGKEDLLSPCLREVNALLSHQLDHEEFVEEAMGIMFAASATISSALIYILSIVSDPKNVQFQQQLREGLGGRSDLATVKRLPYPNAVIKETFRL